MIWAIKSRRVSISFQIHGSYSGLTFSPNPLNLSIKDKSDNVNSIGCQVKIYDPPADWIEKFKTILYKIMMFPLNSLISSSTISRLKKGNMRKDKRYIRSGYAAVLALLVLIIFSMGPNIDTTRALSEADLPVVVIDPGHGGNDRGAQGQDDISEKTVTLNLARLIADQLKTRCQVILTRSDDYGLDISERTAVANQSRGEIFISLHTGASFSRSIGGSTIYYYRQFIESALTAEPREPTSLPDGSQPLSWNQIQKKYRITSERLAKFIQNQLNDALQTPDTRVQGAPLLVLEGADMPAVVIEIGNLSNPKEEKALRDPEFLVDFARAVARGVDTFFTEKSK